MIQLPKPDLRHELLAPASAIARLEEEFPDCPPDALLKSDEPWPPLRGCLLILFTSRSGSTYLCRELEKHFVVGRVGESFNPPQLRARAKRKRLASPAAAARFTIRHLREEGWFAFKAGSAGLAIAESSGFIAEYRERIHLLLLARRDLVGQAVSRVKAKLTSRFHSNQTEVKKLSSEDYSRRDILESMTAIVDRVRTLTKYVELSDMPSSRIFYEDFSGGDLTSLDLICEAFGISRRVSPLLSEERSVEKISDEINAHWRDRFLSESDHEVEVLLKDYSDLISSDCLNRV